VEPACAICLVPFYDVTHKALYRVLPARTDGEAKKTFVVIVCGGSAVSIDKVMEWQKKLQDTPLGDVMVSMFRQ
jgi:hypothetical protein